MKIKLTLVSLVENKAQCRVLFSSKTGMHKFQSWKSAKFNFKPVLKLNENLDLSRIFLDFFLIADSG